MSFEAIPATESSRLDDNIDLISSSRIDDNHLVIELNPDENNPIYFESRLILHMPTLIELTLCEIKNSDFENSVLEVSSRLDSLTLSSSSLDEEIHDVAEKQHLQLLNFCDSHEEFQKRSAERIWTSEERNLQNMQNLQQFYIESISSTQKASEERILQKVQESHESYLNRLEKKSSKESKKRFRKNKQRSDDIFNGLLARLKSFSAKTELLKPSNEAMLDDNSGYLQLDSAKVSRSTQIDKFYGFNTLNASLFIKSYIIKISFVKINDEKTVKLFDNCNQALMLIDQILRFAHYFSRKNLQIEFSDNLSYPIGAQSNHETISENSFLFFHPNIPVQNQHDQNMTYFCNANLVDSTSTVNDMNATVDTMKPLISDSRIDDEYQEQIQKVTRLKDDLTSEINMSTNSQDSEVPFSLEQNNVKKEFDERGFLRSKKGVASGIGGFFILAGSITIGLKLAGIIALPAVLTLVPYIAIGVGLLLLTAAIGIKAHNYYKTCLATKDIYHTSIANKGLIYEN